MVMKPTTMWDLAATVRNILDGKSAGPGQEAKGIPA
jgi:hypothetical protein